MTERGRTTLRWALLIGVVVAITWAFFYRDRFDAAALRGGVSALGIWAPVGFIALYTVGAPLFLPGAVLTLLGGALFGPVWGTLYSLIGATAGASVSFLIARYVASDWVARRAGGRLSKLGKGIDESGWRFVAFVRFVPLFPFTLLNYALGLTRIPFGVYALTSLVCMTPGAFVYAYVGYAGGGAATHGDDVLKKLLIAMSLVLALALLPTLIRRFRRQKNEGL